MFINEDIHVYIKKVLGRNIFLDIYLHLLAYCFSMKEGRISKSSTLSAFLTGELAFAKSIYSYERCAQAVYVGHACASEV